MSDRKAHLTDIASALSAALAPDASGKVRFGDAGEELRLSQQETLAAIKQYWERSGQLGYIVGPGGVGKTRNGIALSDVLHKHGKKTLFVVPSQQALVDFAAKAEELCPAMHVGKVYAGEKRIGDLTFITYASLLKRVLGVDEGQDGAKNELPNGLVIHPKDYDLVVWDEAHMYLTANAQRLLKQFPHAQHVGMTATPRYYEGKEVGEVFGHEIHRISLNTARDRGEICDWTNILYDTGLKTGIVLSSPDQEESEAVARALNRADRNHLIAHLYKNEEINVKRGGRKRRYFLAGEPAIVFCASIDHTHDMADHINKMLAPALKHDEAFRHKLRDKGINPDDPELVIAAPIHTGASASHPGMDLDTRNALVDRYHKRKVLMLVSTSVLQQSFDSPKTSVVFDSVPRQTYVGVAQAGMRATRAGKDMAFIINIQDGDYPSLTFSDFEENRGREEGVRVDIVKRDQHKHHREVTHIDVPELPLVDYRSISGDELGQLVKKRAVQQQRALKERAIVLTPEEMDRVREVIPRVHNGEADAADDLIRATADWRKRVSKQYRREILGGVRVDQDALKDVETDSLILSVAALQEKRLGTWGQLAAHYKLQLGRKMESLLKKTGKRPSHEPLDPNDGHIPSGASLTGRTAEDNARTEKIVDAVEAGWANHFGVPSRTAILDKLANEPHSHRRFYGRIPDPSECIDKIRLYQNRADGDPVTNNINYRDYDLWVDLLRSSPPADIARQYQQDLRFILSKPGWNGNSIEEIALYMEVPKADLTHLLWRSSEPQDALRALTPKMVNKMRAHARKLGGEENVAAFDETMELLKGALDRLDRKNESSRLSRLRAERIEDLSRELRASTHYLFRDAADDLLKIIPKDDYWKLVGWVGGRHYYRTDAKRRWHDDGRVDYDALKLLSKHFDRICEKNGDFLMGSDQSGRLERMRPMIAELWKLLTPREQSSNQPPSLGR